MDISLYIYTHLCTYILHHINTFFHMYITGFSTSKPGDDVNPTAVRMTIQSC